MDTLHGIAGAFGQFYGLVGHYGLFAFGYFFGIIFYNAMLKPPDDKPAAPVVAYIVCHPVKKYDKLVAGTQK